MARSTAILLVALMISFIPTLSFAGAPAGCANPVRPVFDDASGNSGVFNHNAGALTSGGANMNGGTIVGQGALPALLDNTFVLQNGALGYPDQPDFDGNGITDMVQQTPAGFAFGSLLASDGGGWVQQSLGAQIPGPITPDFKTLAYPDINGDGKSDICIQHPNKFTYCYLMDGLTILGEGQIKGPITIDFVSLAFQDMNGDGTQDHIIQHPNGFTYVYLLVPDGGTFVTTNVEGAVCGLITTEYYSLAFPDLNGDGNSDCVIQHPNGFTYAYLQDGIINLSKDQIPGPITIDFVSTGFPDINNDGFSDSIIRDVGGFTYAYEMKPDGGIFVDVLAEGALSPPPTAAFVDTGYPDLECDGNADLTYQEPGGFSVAYLSLGGAPAPGTKADLPATNTGAGEALLDWEANWGMLNAP
jgi:hypothetical protein